MQNLDALDLSGRHLLTFLAILDHRSLTDASRHLSVDPTEVSTVLDNLRRTMRDDLFIRTGRGFEPTEYALQIEPGIRECLSLLEGLASPRNFAPAEETGRITIAANVAELLDEISQIRDAIREEAPNASLRFLELGSRDNIEPLLGSGDADIIITVSAPEYASSLNGCAFSIDKQVIFFDPACRPPVRSLEDYAEAEHATLDFGRGGQSTIDEVLQNQSLSRRISLSVSDVAALGELMKGTCLIATMQLRLSRTALSHLAFCEPPLYLPPQKFDLVWHRRTDNSPRTKWLRELIMRVAEASHYARD